MRSDAYSFFSCPYSKKQAQWRFSWRRPYWFSNLSKWNTVSSGVTSSPAPKSDFKVIGTRHWPVRAGGPRTGFKNPWFRKWTRRGDIFISLKQSGVLCFFFWGGCSQRFSLSRTNSWMLEDLWGTVVITNWWTDSIFGIEPNGVKVKWCLRFFSSMFGLECIQRLFQANKLLRRKKRTCQCPCGRVPLVCTCIWRPNNILLK